jgi:F-type H+-transporting ATPase subunit epsilon
MCYYVAVVVSLTSTFCSLFNKKNIVHLRLSGLCVSKSLLRRDLGRLGMNLEILTPEKKLFSGEVYGVQMPGISGSFEVLEKHAPLVSALKAGRIKVLKDKQNHFSFFDIGGGFVEVLNNKVTVLVEGATALEG